MSQASKLVPLSACIDAFAEAEDFKVRWDGDARVWFQYCFSTCLDLLGNFHTSLGYCAICYSGFVPSYSIYSLQRCIFSACWSSEVDCGNGIKCDKCWKLRITGRWQVQIID